MALYILLFIFITITYILTIDGRINSRSIPLITFFFWGMAIYVGLADMMGGFDRYFYGMYFDNVADITLFGGRYADADIFQVYGSEFGYIYFNILISFITSNRYIFILIITLVIYGLLLESIKKYTDNYPFAIILFLGLIYLYSFTYLRQLMGISIAWLGIKYVKERRLWRFLLVMFISYSFHNSSIIFLPVYFIPLKKFPIDKVILLIVICFVLGITNIGAALFEVYGDTVDEQLRASRYVEDTGFRFVYVLEAGVFLYIILKNYKRIPSDTTHILMLNIALGFCMVLLFFVQSDNGGRLSWYYWIGLIATLNTVVTNKRQSKSRYATLMICISFGLYFRVLVMWGGPTLCFYPYKSFLSDGHRQGDWVYDSNEYDRNYDRDHFYRPAFLFLQK
jgi:hypothetical protein